MLHRKMLAFEVFPNQVRKFLIRIVLDRLSVKEVMVFRHRNIVIALSRVGMINERKIFAAQKLSRIR